MRTILLASAFLVAAFPVESLISAPEESLEVVGDGSIAKVTLTYESGSSNHAIVSSATVDLGEAFALPVLSKINPWRVEIMRSANRPGDRILVKISRVDSGELVFKALMPYAPEGETEIMKGGGITLTLKIAPVKD